MKNFFGSYALEEEGIIHVGNTKEQSKTDEKLPAVHPQKFFGRVIATAKEAQRLITNAATAGYFFGIVGLLMGVASKSSLIVDALILCVLAFFIHKKRSRAAAILLVLFCIAGILLRVVSNIGGMITPVILLWFGWQGMQGTYAWHAFVTRPHAARSMASEDRSSVLNRVIVCLRISEVIYILLGMGLIMLWFSPNDPELLMMPGIMGITMALVIGIIIFLEYVIRALRKKKFWAWVAALCLFGLYVPTLFLPLGILGLIWILDRRTRKEFGIRVVEAHSH